MPDTDPTPAPEPSNTPEPAEPKPPGYFNQAQLEDIEIAEKVLTAARDHQLDLDKKGIDSAYISGLAGFIEGARLKISQTGQAVDASEAATLNATGEERDLVVALQGIQSAAKQKHRMLAEDDDATTNFSTDGYLIGTRLNANRAILLQNADTLKNKAAADSLPGYKTPEALAKIATDIAAYKTATATQSERDQDAAEDRIERDALVKKINARRTAIQHAADALWPYTTEANGPIRKRFKLQPDRPFNG